MIAYRRDIDGLRSIAVLAVVLYHFGIPAFSGGYVGVDVFFVISGLLIGRSIIDDVREKRFSYIRFYERRVRRLLPAAILVFAVTLAASCLILLPPDLRSFGRSLVGATAGLSNIAFYLERGYFDPAAIRKPLLHIWSLAVEEQFYVFLPFVVGVFARRPRTLLPAIVAIAAVSLAAAQLWLPRDPEGVFYLLPYRAWELLFGVIVGQVDRHSVRTHPQLRELMAWAGLSMIVVPIFLYTDATSFPGAAAVPPVLGTALLLFAGRGGGTVVGRLLSARAPVFIGLISYSLYLWHWPIASGINTWTAGARPMRWQVAGMLASLLLATLSWRYVERPFRDRAWIGRWRVFVLAGTGSALLMAAGWLLYASDGWPQRYDRAEAAIVASADDFRQRSGICDGLDRPTMAGFGAVCRLGAPDRAPDLLVWGDSHVRAFQDGLDLAAREHDRAAAFIWAGGCPPVFGIVKHESANTPAVDAACRRQSKGMLTYVVAHPELRDVVLIGRWSYYFEGGGTGRDRQNIIRLADTSGREASGAQQRRAMFGHALAATVDWLVAHGRHVFIVEQVPEIPESDAGTAAIQIVTHQASRAEVVRRFGTVPRAVVEQRQQAAERLLAALAARPNVTVLRTHDRLCDARVCSAWYGGRILLFDNNHLTVEGSKALRGIFAPVFAGR